MRRTPPHPTASPSLVDDKEEHAGRRRELRARSGHVGRYAPCSAGNPAARSAKYASSSACASAIGDVGLSEAQHAVQPMAGGRGIGSRDRRTARRGRRRAAAC